ncbi:amidohydrolase family protein [Pseudoxanthomonas sp. X-1]|uniref:amidohydrolase family protein n=1 Tax=Pseudoxanthomonas sp. X-1 TaxID=2571115 RepID=UPI00110AFD05|nr:amidohydrolase family protein [Pseudoxanthomonas sp. X-1]TMN25169.1 amidohydrolase [Pseudoxanthomonas sp. X-1]UAY74817.1 amidohydrolase family protein [Pseudoxanthomonas sp. X-1]
MSGWDCHAHVFGPYARFPLADTSVHSPPQASVEQYLALLQALDLQHGVLIHPSAYGRDFSALFDALDRFPQLRGVAVARVQDGVDLRGLRERGVRALRFSHRSGGDFPGAATLEDLKRLAPALAAAGLHAELWSDTAALSGVIGTLRELPVPLVIDHASGFDLEAGVDAPAFRALLSLLEGGNTWIKLCMYRNLLRKPQPERGRAFQLALQQARADRMLWGSDWPHLRVEPAPETGALLETFRDWAGDAALARRILEDHPRALYA